MHFDLERNDAKIKITLSDLKTQSHPNQQLPVPKESKSFQI